MTTLPSLIQSRASFLYANLQCGWLDEQNQPTGSRRSKVLN
jgi:hypothetical protein